MSKDISVLIPVYKVENYIEKCLTSLFNNTIVNITEIIIVNDCTPDNSILIATRLIQDYKKINPALDVQIINHDQNQGLGQSRITAFNAATGKYIICVDSDDWVEPNFLEALYAKAVETNADCVICNYFIESQKTKKLEHQRFYTGHECVKNLLKGDFRPNVWVKLFKREIFIKNNINWTKNVDNLEDDLICSKFFSYAMNIQYIDDYLYHYRKNKDSLSYAPDVNYYIESMKVYNIMFDFFEERNLMSIYEHEIKFPRLRMEYKKLRVSKFSDYKKINHFSKEDYKFIKEENIYTNKVLLYVINFMSKRFFLLSDISFMIYKTMRFIKTILKKIIII